jgi:RNA polymerase sigma-54 factor
MAITPKLELRQGQGLVMTPQLQQAIKLLQLSNLELAAFVDTELERNPLLEREDAEEPIVSALRESPELELSAFQESARGDAENGDASSRGDSETGMAEAEEGEAEWLDLQSPKGNGEADLDTDAEDLFPDVGAFAAASQGEASWFGIGQGGQFDGADAPNLEAYVAEPRTLKDHLSEQLVLAFADAPRRLIGQHLIDMTDESGYLRGDFAAVAELLGAPEGMVEETLSSMQGFDPIGVFARDLRECLLLQLKELDRCDPAMAALVDHLPLLAAHDLSSLKRACAVSDEDLLDMIQELKRLNPRPGLRYGASHAQPIVPDVLVRNLPDGSWHVELNTETLPRVLVNRVYYARVSKARMRREEKSYLADCLQNANWLVKSLDQRARTILKVAEEIVRQQDAFLTYGVRYLRPLNLKTVADAISMHESTVSRVTANKYMATNRGLFELKYFFTSAIAASGEGEAHSAEAVRHRIKEMIDAEQAADVLSDDKIVEKLKSDGIDIARRTVAKYREAMRIPSSVDRRRRKRLAVDLQS